MNRSSVYTFVIVIIVIAFLLYFIGFGLSGSVNPFPNPKRAKKESDVAIYAAALKWIGAINIIIFAFILFRLHFI